MSLLEQNRAVPRHFDFLCAAIEAAISGFGEGRREGDCGLLHIDDLNAIRNVLGAAHGLCDATEGTIITDEFGPHLRVPDQAWRELADAMRGETQSPPAARAEGVAALQQAGEPVAFDRLTRYPTYVEDAEGLARIRTGLMEVRDWHDLPGAIINCNSLARLLDTIEYLKAVALFALPQQTALVEQGVEE